MLVIGDIHGKHNEYLQLLARFPDEASIQIGDFGFGFRTFPDLPEDAWFFRGNHDSPDLCRENPNYLGDYGYREIGGVKVFFVAGAWSIDQYRRVEGVSWWRDEEMSVAELGKAFDLYLDIKPDIVLSHDGPKQATDAMLRDVSAHKPYMPTRTDQALSAMFAAHQPKQWFFGHWHIDWCGQIGNTTFRCLPELGWAQIESQEAA